MARLGTLTVLALGISVSVCFAEESLGDTEVGVSASGPADELTCKALPLPGKKQHLAYDISDLTRIVTDKSKELHRESARGAPTNVKVFFEAADVFPAKVGPHSVETHLEFADGTKTCFDVQYYVDNTNECTIADEGDADNQQLDELEKQHEMPEGMTKAQLVARWNHNCDSTTQCVDAPGEGTYHCECLGSGANQTFGGLFAGSVKLDYKDGYSIFNPCHGHTSTEHCCSFNEEHMDASKLDSETLDEDSRNLHAAIACNGAECVTKCKESFFCEKPCDAIDRIAGKSKDAHNTKQHLTMAKKHYDKEGDIDTIRSFMSGKTLEDFGAECIADSHEASFEVQCKMGYKLVGDDDPFPNGATRYEWHNRTLDEEYILYRFPSSKNINIECEKIKVKKFCNKKQTMDCPCNCACAEAEEGTEEAGTGYFCEPEKGFMKVNVTELKAKYPTLGKKLSTGNIFRDRLDDHLCVDETPPEIKLNGAAYMKMKQGDDEYEDKWATFEDKNNDEDIPKMVNSEISPELYGEKMQIPCESGKCTKRFVTDVGKYTVTYSQTLPWLENSPFSKTREVEIVNVNECEYDGEAPRFKNMCYNMETANEADDETLASAKCVDVVMEAHNTGPGYYCECPEGYEGSAFSDDDAYSFFENGVLAYKFKKPYEELKAAIRDEEIKVVKAIKSLDAAKSELEAAKSALGEVSTELDELKSKDDNATDEGQVKAKTEEVEAAQEKVTSATDKVTDVTQELEGAEKKVTELTQELETTEQYQLMEKFLKLTDGDTSPKCQDKLKPEIVPIAPLIAGGLHIELEALVVESRKLGGKKSKVVLKEIITEESWDVLPILQEGTLDNGGDGVSQWLLNYCKDAYSNCFKGVDKIPDDKVFGKFVDLDLTEFIKLKSVSLLNDTDPEFKVYESKMVLKDKNDNLAELDMQIKVYKLHVPELYQRGNYTNMLDMWKYGFYTTFEENKQNQIALMFAIMIALIVFFNLSVMINIMLDIYRFLQLLVFGRSLIYDPTAFRRGFTTKIFLLSLGTNYGWSEVEVERALEDEWQRLQQQPH